MVLGLVAARPTVAPPPTLPPAVVLFHYARALETVAVPTTLSFQYTIEQLGGPDLEQTHRVYRSGTDVRDETLTSDGDRIVPPRVRIVHGKRDRYAVTNIAPRPDAYDFAYVGPHTVGSHVEYIFRTTPKVPGPFMVTQVAIDGVKFLPRVVEFRTMRDGVVGHGAITYGPSGKYWIPATATATAREANRTTRETIVFSAYDFPTALPPGTFGVRPRE